MNWQETAFLFPGQGSQTVGMTQTIAEAFPTANTIFTKADDILGYAISDYCFQGPEDKLNQTEFTQPALFVAGVATHQALIEYLGETPTPAFVAGHSLGEFTALVAANALTFEDGLRLVKKRAELMRDAGEQSPGAVAAILGLDIEVVRQLCADASQQTGEIVVVANDNCPGQVVISGAEAALDAALALASEQGAKRAVKLPVSVAVHSPLMQAASEEFAAAVASTPIQAPSIPVIGNVTATRLTTAEAIQDELTKQITASVLWTGSVQAMLVGGVTQFVEFGPGGVLLGLVKRIDRKAKRISLEQAEHIQALETA